MPITYLVIPIELKSEKCLIHLDSIFNLVLQLPTSRPQGNSRTRIGVVEPMKECAHTVGSAGGVLTHARNSRVVCVKSWFGDHDNRGTYLVMVQW
jgi:hypothetical protein